MVEARECAVMLLGTLHPLMRTMRDATRQIKLEDRETPTIEQFRMLQVLAAQSRNLRELAARHAVSASTMSRSIEVVVQRGWVSRTPDPDDRRQIIVTLTSEGRAIHDATVKQVEDHLTARLATLGPADCERLHAALDTVRDLLAASSPDHGDDHCHNQQHHARTMEQTR